MGQEVDGDTLGDEFKGYVFKITGGNDKDGFSMKQGVLVQGRVRLLMKEGHKCYRPRRAGERKRKSVRGCIVGPDLSVLALAIVKAGEQPIAGLTDNKVPKRLGPKRATRIRKLFALTKDDDVRRYVIRRKIEKEGKPVRYKAPRIQRLVTDARLRRKRIYRAEKKARWQRTRKAVEDYHKVLEEYRKKKAANLKEAVQHRKELANQKHQPKGPGASDSKKGADDKKAAPAPKGNVAQDKKTGALSQTKPTAATTSKTNQAANIPATQKGGQADKKGTTGAQTDKKGTTGAQTDKKTTTTPQGKGGKK